LRRSGLRPLQRRREGRAAEIKKHLHDSSTSGRNRRSRLDIIIMIARRPPL
jgi:hypothetical protein